MYVVLLRVKRPKTLDGKNLVREDGPLTLEREGGSRHEMRHIKIGSKQSFPKGIRL